MSYSHNLSCPVLLHIPKTHWKLNKDREDLTSWGLKTKAKAIESHQNKTRANHFGFRRIAHTHRHAYTHADDRTTPESWPSPAPYCSALACVQNKLGLSVGNCGGLRPECLAGAEGAAGCQWSVLAVASGNGVMLTPTQTPPPRPHIGRLLSSGPGAEVEEEPQSYERAAGLAVMDELTLAKVQTRGEPGPQRLSCLHEVTLQA